MNILEVHNSWDEAEPGGIVSMLQELMLGLEHHHQISLLVNDWSCPTPTVRKDRAGRSYFRFRMPRPPSSLWHIKAWLLWPIRFIFAIRRLLAFCRVQHIDVIHLHYPEAAYLVFAVAEKLGGPPYVVTSHGGDAMRFSGLPGIHRRAQCRLLVDAAAVTCVANWLGGKLQGNCPGLGAPYVIPNGMQALSDQQSDRASIEASLGFALPEEFVVLVGNCRPVKGQDIALDAWALLKEEGADVPPLLMVGGGPQLAEMQRRSEALGLGDRVLFSGHVPRPLAVGLSSLASLQVAPSRSEGHPVVALEAGHVGTPLVASDIPAFREVIEDGVTGYLFESESAAGLARGVRRIWSDPQHAAAMGQRLRERVAADFSVEAMVTSYERLFFQITSRQQD